MTMYINLRAGLNSKPTLIDIKEDINKFITSRDKDWYVSLYKYNDAHKARLEEKGTLAGITDTLTNNLYFDFDSKPDPVTKQLDLETARAEAIEVANRLITRGFEEDNIGCYFTGGKGFSIEVETNEYVTPEKFKAIVFDVAGDLTTFDGVVNDPNRIVRIQNTKHQNSGLYKIPLTPEELTTLTIPEIKLLAKNPRAGRLLTIANLPQNIKDVEPVKEKSVDRIAQELTFDISSIDMKARLPKVDEPRHLLLNGFFRAGERNPAMLCLSATLKNVGYDLDQTRALMITAAEKQASRTGEDQFPEKEVDLILSQVFSANWKGGQFTTRDPANWLAQYCRKMGLAANKEDEGPATLDWVGGGFASYIKNMKANTIKTGIPELDRAMPITLGSNIGIVAAAGAGKTSLALKILKNTSEQGILSVFASLDMSRNRLFEKVVYNLTGLDRDAVYLEFTEGRGDKIIALVKKHYGNVWFYDRSSATVDDVRQYILDVEAKTGEKVKMVMFDYFERISSDMSDETASSKKVAGQIQDLVNDLEIASLCLTQPNKFSLGGGPDTELTSYTAIKGSSFLYQSFRGIISMSRPFYTPATKDIDKYCVLSLLKNDLGQQERFELGWDGKRGDIYTLEDHERDEFHALMKIKNGKKEDKNGGWE